MPISKIKTSSITADASSVNLNIDENTLFLDVANNRVGVGTTSPASNLHIAGTASTIRNAASTGSSWFIGSNVDSYILHNISNTPMVFTTNSTERMRIDSSGNLGIGTSSPAAKLDVAGTSDGDNVIRASTNSSNGIVILRPDGANGNALRWGGNGANANIFRFISGGDIERARIDSGGNFGLGVTPSINSLSGSGYRGLEVGSPAGTGIYAGGYELFLQVNAYYNSGFRYSGSTTASQYVQSSGTHRWLTAPSGTAGNIIPFTQAMTLDPIGNLGIGVTSPNPNRRIDIALNTNSSTGVIITNNNAGSATSANTACTNGTATSEFGILGTGYGGYGVLTPGSGYVYVGSGKNLQFASDGGYIAFGTGSTNPERVRIDSSGSVGIGVTDPSAYNSKLVVNGRIATSTASYYSTLFDSYFANSSFWASAIGVPNDGVTRWIPIIGGAAVTATQGYVTQGVFGVKKSSSASFAMGAYIGVTANSDNGPGREFLFDTGGNFSAPGAKSFKIPHPLPEKSGTHELWHVALEGPNLDLIYRGSVDLVDGKAQVNIDAVSRMTEGTFVALTKDAQSFTSNESDWTPVRGSVTGNILSIEAQDNTATSNVSWMVIAKRNDNNVINESTTDDNGDFITERTIN